MKSKVVLIVVVLLGLGGLFVAVLGCCAGGLYLGFKSTDAAVSPRIDEMFEAIDAGRFGDTYETETTPELRATASREKYETIGRMIKTRLGRLQSKSMVSFNARQMNADSFVDVVYQAKFEKGSGTIKARLKKEQGKWMFNSFFVDSPEFLQDLATAACPKCGAAHAAGAKFCPACGAALAEAPPSEQGSAAAPPDEREPSEAPVDEKAPAELP